MHGGICNYHLEQYEEAIAHYKIALDKPDKEETGVKFGEILYHKGLSNACLMKFDEARDDYELAKTKVADAKIAFKIKFQLGKTLRRIAGNQKETTIE